MTRTRLDFRSARRDRSKLHLQTPFEPRSFRILVLDRTSDRDVPDRLRAIDDGRERGKVRARREKKLPLYYHPAARPSEMELPVPDMATTTERVEIFTGRWRVSFSRASALSTTRLPSTLKSRL